MKRIFLFLLFCVPLLLQAQQAIVSLGGDATDAGGSLSFSAGEAFYQVDAYGDGSLSGGVQAPHEIVIVSIREEAEKLDLPLLVYPNPVRNTLILQTDITQRDDLHYQLLDFSGRLLEKAAIDDAKTLISTHNLDPGLYLLRVSGKNKALKTFKVLKIHSP